MAQLKTSIWGPCADPGIFPGGIQVRGSENSLNKVFFVLFFSPQLILQFTEGVHWFHYRENYTFPWIQRGSNIFHRGGQLLSRGGGWGGPNANFSMGGPEPLSPLWIRTWDQNRDWGLLHRNAIKVETIAKPWFGFLPGILTVAMY